MDFDDFCRFFERYYNLFEKQQTKQTNYISLSLSASLDIQDTLQDGIIVEWKEFWQEIPVCVIIEKLFALNIGKIGFRYHIWQFYLLNDFT